MTALDIVIVFGSFCATVIALLALLSWLDER